MEQVPHCRAVTARCVRSVGMLLCASLHTSLEQSISTVPPCSLNPLISQFPKPTSVSDVEGEEGWGWVSPRLGELLGALGLGCLPLVLSSWQPSVSALQTGSSLLSPLMNTRTRGNSQFFFITAVRFADKGEDGLPLIKFSEARLKDYKCNLVHFGKNAHLKTLKILLFPALLNFIRKWDKAIMELAFIHHLTGKTWGPNESIISLMP